MSVRESVEELRSELGIEPADAALAPLYEAYLKRDTVSAKEGAALLVGLDPAAAPSGAGPFGSIEAALAEAAGTGTQISIDTLVQFAEVEAVMLPRACTDLYGFIKKTVLGVKISAETPFAGVSSSDLQRAFRTAELAWGGTVTLRGQLRRRLVADNGRGHALERPAGGDKRAVLIKGLLLRGEGRRFNSALVLGSG